jgi:hypothetical protein
MGEKGVKYMRERFCWRKIAEQFIEVALLHKEKLEKKLILEKLERH